MEKEILNKLFETTKELPPSTEYWNINKEFVKARDLFLQDIATQDGKSLEKLIDLQNQMSTELSRQAFCEGFSIAVRLFIEATYKERDDQEK